MLPRLPSRNVVLLIREGEETEGRKWIEEGGMKGGEGKKGEGREEGKERTICISHYFRPWTHIVSCKFIVCL